MEKTVQMMPAGHGESLFIKDFREEEDGRCFLKYKTTANDIPFTETQVQSVDGGQNIAIIGDDGTILYRFHVSLLAKILPEDDKTDN